MAQRNTKLYSTTRAARDDTPFPIGATSSFNHWPRPSQPEPHTNNDEPSLDSFGTCAQRVSPLPGTTEPDSSFSYLESASVANTNQINGTTSRNPIVVPDSRPATPSPPSPFHCFSQLPRESSRPHLSQQKESTPPPASTPKPFTRFSQPSSKFTPLFLSETKQSTPPPAPKGVKRRTGTVTNHPGDLSPFYYSEAEESESTPAPKRLKRRDDIAANHPRNEPSYSEPSTGVQKKLTELDSVWKLTEHSVKIAVEDMVQNLVHVHGLLFVLVHEEKVAEMFAEIVAKKAKL